MYKMEFRTNSRHGLLLLEHKTTSALSDFLAIAINDGRVEVTFNLGKDRISRLPVARSQVDVVDGNWHSLILSRLLCFIRLFFQDSIPCHYIFFCALYEGFSHSVNFPHSCPLIPTWPKNIHPYPRMPTYAHPLLTHSNSYPPQMPTRAYTEAHSCQLMFLSYPLMSTDADDWLMIDIIVIILMPISIHANTSSLIPTHTHLCLFMLIHAHSCPYMLTHANLGLLMHTH